MLKKHLIIVTMLAVSVLATPSAAAKNAASVQW